MKRVNAILDAPLYRRCYARLEELERERIFCCHQMTHLLDVARIAYILNMEQDMGLEKEVIYAAAVLHDIGKYAQYEDGTPTNSRERRLPRRYWIRFLRRRRFPRRRNA